MTYDGEAVVFDTRTKVERARIQHEGEVSGSRAALSANGLLLAMTHGFGDFENAISLWDTFTGERLGTLTGHKQAIWSLAFTPDGKTLASSSGDGSLQGSWSEGTGTREASGSAGCRLRACGPFFDDPGEDYLQLTGTWEEDGSWDWVGKLGLLGKLEEEEGAD